jgi:hypothetical protein
VVTKGAIVSIVLIFYCTPFSLARVYFARIQRNLIKGKEYRCNGRSRQSRPSRHKQGNRRGKCELFYQIHTAARLFTAGMRSFQGQSFTGWMCSRLPQDHGRVCTTSPRVFMQANVLQGQARDHATASQGRNLFHIMSNKGPIGSL